MTGDRTLPSPVLVTVATAKQVQMKEHYLVASWRTGSSLPTEVDPAGNGGSGAATLAPFPGKNGGGGGGGRSGESRRRTGDRVPPARDDPTEQVDRTGYRNRNRRGRGAMNSHHGSPLPQEGRVVNNAFAHINRSQHPVEYARAVSSPDMWASNMHEPHSAYYPNYVSSVYPDDGSAYSNMMNGNEFGAIPYSSGYGNSFEGNNMTGGGVRGPRRRRRGGGGGTVPKRETSGGDLASNFREGRARGKQPDTTIHGVHVKAHGDSNHIQAQCKEFAEMAGIQMREIVQLPSHLQERQSQASSNNIEEVLSVVISSPSDISRSHTPVLGPDDTADGVPLAKPVIPQSFQPQPTPEVSSSLVCEDRLPKIDLLIIVGAATDATQLSDVLRQKPSHPNAPYTVHILNNHGDRSGHHASPSPTLILKNIPRTSTCELLTEELSRLPWKPLSVQFQGNPRGPFHGVAIAVYPSTGEAERVKLVLDHFSIGEPKKILRVSFGYKDKKNQDSQLINPASASNKTTAPNSIVHEELDLDDNEPEPSEEVRAHFDVHLLGLKQSSSEELSMRYLRSSLTLPELKYLRTAAGKLGLRFELSAEHASIICVSGAEGGPLKQNASADLTKNLSYRGSSHWKQVGQRNVEQFLPIESTIGPNDSPPPKPFGAGRGKPI